jgi:hypothetical protein
VVTVLHHNRLVDRKKFAPKEVLRQNVQACLDSGVGPTSQLALHKKCGAAQATIGRIVGKHGENAKLETIAAIAKAYDLEAWQLLIAGMDPKNPPALAPVTKEQREFWARVQALYEETRSTPK